MGLVQIPVFFGGFFPWCQLPEHLKFSIQPGCNDSDDESDAHGVFFSPWKLGPKSF